MISDLKGKREATWRSEGRGSGQKGQQERTKAPRKERVGLFTREGPPCLDTARKKSVEKLSLEGERHIMKVLGFDSSGGGKLPGSAKQGRDTISLTF